MKNIDNCNMSKSKNKKLDLNKAMLKSQKIPNIFFLRLTFMTFQRIDESDIE